MIHPTAIVAPGAKLAPDVEVGPYTIIGEHVEIDAGTRIGPHAVIAGHTRIGIGNMNAKTAREIEEKARQLGNAYLPGAQAALHRYTKLFSDDDAGGRWWSHP